MNSHPTPPSQDKLAVLIPGMGAVATTFIAGVHAARTGRSHPTGSLTQLGHVPNEQGHLIPFPQVLPMASLSDLVFGGWDIYDGNAFEAAERANVLNYKDMKVAEEILSSITPMKAVFDQEYVRNISGPNIKTGLATKMDQAMALVDDIKTFMADNGASRGVGIWCGSTEVYVEMGEVHQTLEAFEEGMRQNHPEISPSMLYTYAFIEAGVPYANGAPNTSTDVPALVEFALSRNVALSGKDYKTGQTLMKTILAPGFAARMIGVRGWYSTNILGNTDGAVLDDPGSFKSKEKTKLSVLESILDAQMQPELYEKMDHKVRIDYYPPRGDNKEGWDNIDIFGWMGYDMQIKINFLCRDSILAAPLVLDLALLMDAAQRSGRGGVQEWLSFFFKSPQTIEAGAQPVHNLFEQLEMLQTEATAIGHDLRRAATTVSAAE